MANADIFHKGKPCDPATASTIDFALDAPTGLYKGTGLDTLVANMAGAGMPFYTATEVSRFKGEKDALDAKVAALVTLEAAVDAAAQTLSTDLANGTKIAAVATAWANVTAAQLYISMASSSINSIYNGKLNPYR